MPNTSTASEPWAVREFRSDINGRNYAIRITTPTGPPPLPGYRQLYVLDGDAYFQSAVEMVLAQPELADMVVVGIGYPTSPRWTERQFEGHPPRSGWLAPLTARAAALALARRFDLTLPATAEQLASQSIATAPADTRYAVGGLDDFLEVVDREVKSIVGGCVPIDATRQCLFGHSLGGLAVIAALFGRPDSYSAFAASSPSLWWNDRAILNREAAFLAQLSLGACDPSVLITVGGEEQTVPSDTSFPGVDPDRLRAQIERAAMITNAESLAARIAAARMPGARGRTAFRPLPGFGHAMAAWPALAASLDFAFKPQGQ